MADPIITALIRQGSRQRGLDPAAVLAVAMVEGGLRRGAIGDQGTSFGTFQLHQGGALPRGRGLNWADSRAGINFALDRIAGVARGKRGQAAVNAIVRGFERPAAPGQEIAKALANYGKIGGGSVAAMTPAARPALDSRSSASPDLTGLFNFTRSIVGLPESAVSLAPPTMPARRAYTRQATPAPGAPGAPFKMKRGKTINFLTHFAQPFGVQVTSTTHGNHVRGSLHYRGRAVDFGGDPARMAALARAALSHPQDFDEMFFTGPGNPGFFIKHGKVYPNSQLDRSVADNHHDHVHLGR